MKGKTKAESRHDLGFVGVKAKVFQLEPRLLGGRPLSVGFFVRGLTHAGLGTGAIRQSRSAHDKTCSVHPINPCYRQA